LSVVAVSVLKMQVTLLGTGDTTGTPTVGCECDTCQTARNPDETVREQAREQGATIAAGGGVERSRFSIHIYNERTDQSLLVDFSPDFRRQFLREEVSLPDEAIITHVHFDHLDGLGNCFRLVDELTVHAANETDPQTGKSVAQTVADNYHYLDQIDVTPQAPLESFEACGLEITLVPVDHPPLLCYGLVVRDPETGAKLSLSGDTSYALPEESREALADPDLLWRAIGNLIGNALDHAGDAPTVWVGEVGVPTSDVGVAVPDPSPDSKRSRHPPTRNPTAANGLTE